MDTKTIGKVDTMLCGIGNTTVIEAGDLVDLDTGLITKVDANSTKVARAQKAHASGGGTTIVVSKGKIELIMDASDVFAVSQRGGEYDVAVDGDGKQTINQSGTSKKVLMMHPDASYGTVGSTEKVRVIINKPIDERA